MSKIDEIYRKRLESIRDELDIFLEYINSLPVLMQDIPNTIVSNFSPNLYLRLKQKKSAPVVEKVEQVKEKDTAQEPKKTVQSDKPVEMPHEQNQSLVKKFSQSNSVGSPQYLSTGRPSGASGGGSAGPMMASYYMRTDSERPELDKMLAKKEESFSQMLLRLIDERNMKDSEAYRRADIDRRLFSKIRSDDKYMPSRNTALSFCLALQLELEDAKKLLATAGYTLSPSSRSDLIISYLIEHKEYNIHFANIVLADYGEGTLSR